MNNRQLIDAFKAKFQLLHDLDVAEVLEVARPVISDWISGRRPMPVPKKFRLLQLIEFPNTAQFAPLFVDPTELAQMVLQDRKAIARLKKAQEQSNRKRT
jgi:plasmid maintenance system antidote protein VapI